MCCKNVNLWKNKNFLFLHLFIICQQKQFMTVENCIEGEIFKCKKINVSPAVFGMIIFLYFDKRALRLLVPTIAKINMY